MTAVAKHSAPAAGALAISGLGFWAGKPASDFAPHFVDAATIAALVLVYIGGAMAILLIAKDALVRLQAKSAT